MCGPLVPILGEDDSNDYVAEKHPNPTDDHDRFPTELIHV
jgi:hypothetical protein